MAIFALKQTVDFYCNQDTPVYMCFLDAKKAFDRVNHWTLAKKLLDRNVPLHIVIIFHAFFDTPRRSSHVKSGKTHTQSSTYTS